MAILLKVLISILGIYLTIWARKTRDKQIKAGDFQFRMFGSIYFWLFEIGLIGAFLIWFVD